QQSLIISLSHRKKKLPFLELKFLKGDITMARPPKSNCEHFCTLTKNSPRRFINYNFEEPLFIST
ncbi:MAG: hypothetical protein ACP5J6_11280, partial [Candidatus Saccharicenans sp.]